MASPGTGAKSFLMAALEQQITNNQVGAPYTTLPASNWGLLQYPVLPGAIFARNDGWAVPQELNGYAGSPAALPGRIERPLDVSMSLRTSALVPILATNLGKPSTTKDGANSAWTYAYTISDASANAVSMWGLFHKGGDTKPVMFSRARFGELGFVSNGQEVTLSAKGAACLDTEHGVGVAEAGNSGTYTANVPIIMGDRGDANRLTDTLYVKISSAPTLGVFKVQVKLGSGGSYSTLETSIAYSTVSKKQTTWVELFNDAGALGFDECENRSQVLIWFPGDVSTLALGDIFTFPATCQIPGTAAQGGDTTVARAQIAGCRFGPAHVSLKKGTSSADTSIDFESGSVKLKRDIVPAFTHGAGARNPYDMDVTGYVGFEIEIDRRFDSRIYEQLMRTNDRYVMEVKFEAQLITGSTWRETVQFDLPQVRVDKSASPLTGPGITKEKLTFVVEQKSDGTAPVTATIKSGVLVDFTVI